MCDLETDACVATNNAAPCDDGNFCTVDDACAEGACAPGAARDCSDDDSCTDDTCDESADQCAHGPASVAEIVERHGDLAPWRTFQKQPEWRGRPVEQQLRRFMGSGGRRKIRYAKYLVDELDLARMPRPLDGVLEHV